MAGPLYKKATLGSKIQQRIRTVKFNLLKSNYFNLIMLIIMLLSALIIFFPILLRIDFIKSFVSVYLEPLKTLEYKSAFLALLGGLLGTFISIFGALTIQSKFTNIEREQERVQKKIQGIVFFNRAVSKEFFKNIDAILEEFHGIKSKQLSCSQLESLKKQLDNTKFISYFEKLFDLNPELTLLLSELYAFVEEIMKTEYSSAISIEKYELFVVNYNKYQMEFNH